jgi:hypothetical protein
MVRPGTYVDAVPDQVMARVFGKTKPDPQVEIAVLIFEYWRRGGATESLLLKKMVPVLKYALTPDNAYRFIGLLSARGETAPFFDLTRPVIDRDRELRSLLELKGIDHDTIRFYASWNGISPEDFARGFVIGVTESFVSVVSDLQNLGKLVSLLGNGGYGWLVRLSFEPGKALTDLWSQVLSVSQAFANVLSQLDPRALPDKVIAMWRDWNDDFAAHLEHLDAEAAGRQLGLLAGTLWQLLTGLVALASLLRIAGGRQVLRYGSLLLGSARSAAREAVIVLQDVAAVLRVWTQETVDALPRVGMWFLHTLFPPRMIQQAIRQGRVFLTRQHGVSLVAVFDQSYGLAFEGARMGPPMAFAVVKDKEPRLLISMTEHLPESTGGIGVPIAGTDAALDDLEAIAKELDVVLADTVRPDALDAGVAAAAQMAQAAQRLKGPLREILHQVTLEAFNELRASGKRFGGLDLGNLIHRKMAARLVTDLGKIAPQALVRTEITTATLVQTLASDSRVAASLAKDATTALKKTIASLVMRDPEVMRLLGIPANARSEAEVGAILQKQFGWTTTKTTIGELKSDLIVADPMRNIVRNVDFTSSTKLEKFEELWNRAIKDLKTRFDGNPDHLEKAYKAAFSGEIPAEVKKTLDTLTTHALRETVIRRLALQRVLGPGWHVSSEEMLYESLARLWRPE